MNNIVEFEAISEKIKGLENELDTFVQVIREIKEIRRVMGALPADLERNREEIEERKNELDTLIASVSDQLATFEKRAGDLISDLEKKADALVREAGEMRSAEPNAGNKHLDIHRKVINRKIKKIEENFYSTLTRQKYAIVIMSSLFIAAMIFFAYVFFIQ